MKNGMKILVAIVVFLVVAGIATAFLIDASRTYAINKEIKTFSFVPLSKTKELILARNYNMYRNFYMEHRSVFAKVKMP
jgi:hypothetical protein